MINFYQILGVSANSTNEEIRTAYRKLATKFHPDKNFGDKYFEERFKEIQLAYDTLSNEYLRIEYNKKLFQYHSKTSSNNTQNRDSQATNSNKQKKSAKPEKLKKNFGLILKEILLSKSNIIWFIIIILPVIAYLINSWLGLISIIGIYLCILMFIGTIDDKEKTIGGCLFGFIGAPILAIYIIVQIFNYFFATSPQKNIIEKNSSANSRTVPIDSSLVDDSHYPIDSSMVIIDTKRPEKYNVLNNGDSPLKQCFGSGKFSGQAYITFKNSNETDAIVCLVDYSNHKTIRNEYIQSGTDFTMRKIPSGTYFLKVYYGNDWNPEKTNFCNSKGGFNFDESFSKSDGVGDLIDIENTGRSYTTGTITLYKVANGNMSSEQINQSEFFN